MRGYALIRQLDGRIRREDLEGRSRASVLRLLDRRVREAESIVGVVFDPNAERDELPHLRVVGDA